MVLDYCERHDHWFVTGRKCRPCEMHDDTIAALRAENKFLAATLHSETAIKVEYEARIAKLEAALRDARYLLENHASEKHVLERIAAVLKGDAE